MQVDNVYLEPRFKLDTGTIILLRTMIPQFGYSKFGEFIFYSHYSRQIDGRQESWVDVVIRVIEGTFSIRKDWYNRNHIAWDELSWQRYARDMAISMFRMEWLPPGRGLWAMGTPLIMKRGSMALFNCAFTSIGSDWIDDLCWLMDSLMHGVGVGFEPIRQNLELFSPVSEVEYVIPDTREGWVDSIRVLLNAFAQPNGMLPVFDYDFLRPEGSKLVTFGGTSSGPQPLKDLHEDIVELCYSYLEQGDPIEFKTDLANLIGVCVVTGNVRRSAELALCSVSDPIFFDLKDYSKHPRRKKWGWMSNNSVKLETSEDFGLLSLLVHHNIESHDIGFVNMINLKTGRIGKRDKLKEDQATGLNPCGEIPLESREVCNVAETLPTRCYNHEAWLNACEYASFYTSTVNLLATHQPSTNAVILRNRRIGVSIVDFSGWKHQVGVTRLTRYLREGYNRIRQVNKLLAQEAGIPESIRVTTVKPGGTVPKMAGRQAGMSHPNFTYMIRRVRIQVNTELERILKEAKIPNEPDYYSKQTTVFEFPIFSGHVKPADQISIWEQAMNLILLQREWADNAISNTLLFSDNEVDELEAVLGAIAPLTKSVSLMRHTKEGIYRQMPEEHLTKEQYETRCTAIKEIDWSRYRGDGQDEKFCTSDRCEVLA